MEEVWIEKYRPKSLSEVVGQTEIVERLKAYVKSKSMPHLMFAGRAGTGKTTCALALVREFFGEGWKFNFQELNASDERGIDVVRTKIKDFARMAPIGSDFKVIFLDESDALTSDAQAALRRTMEMYSRTCRFILSCNYSSKIIEPIQSRCAVFSFRPLRPEDVKVYLERVAEKEGLELQDDGIDALIYVAQGDLRKATNSLQVAAALTTKIDDESIYRSTQTVRPEEIKDLINTALEGDFTKARKGLETILIDYALSGEDLIRQIHRNMYDLQIKERDKVRLVDHIGEVEFRMVEGANPRIQLESLLAHFALVGEEIL
ncbi:MAG: replication factor C small subunit [Candidatus Thermoplasmatota archaeon]|nr:replication factor C small subunit [Candidatus Thermoplasmatota archaeon]